MVGHWEHLKVDQKGTVTVLTSSEIAFDGYPLSVEHTNAVAAWKAFGAEALFVDADDHLGHIRTVREQLSTHREIRFGPYTPHITLGNYTHSYPTTPIKTHLESLQPICGTLNFDTVEWVEFTPQGNRKALRRIKSVHRGTKT